MTDLRKAAEMALEALMQKGEHHPKVYQAAEALRQALAQPEHKDWCASLTQVLACYPPRPAPCNCKPKREWVGLTRRELDIATLGLEDLGDCYVAIEAKLKEKNNG